MRGNLASVFLAATALLLAHGAFAQFPNTIVVQKAFAVPASAGNFTDATVSCPAGYDAISGGLDNMNSDHLQITSLAPTFAGIPLMQQPDGPHAVANGWHASVVNNDTVSHQAFISVTCAQNTGISVVINSLTVAAATAAGPIMGYQQADCPSGQVAIAGGIDLEHPATMKMAATSGFYTGPTTFILDLDPGTNAAPVGWAQMIRNHGPTTGIMKVAAMCTSMSGVITIVSDYQTIEEGEHDGIAVSCPAGYSATAGGFDTNAKEDFLTGTVDTLLYSGSVRPADRADGQYSAPIGWFADAVSNSTDGPRKMKTGVVCMPPAGKLGDIDLDGSYKAETDGLLVLRYLFGLTGNALTASALGNTAQRTNAAEIHDYLDSIRSQLDVDLNGQSDPLTDGMLIVRYLQGLRNAALINGVVAPNATRKVATDIQTYLGSLFGP
jgi:hypothetical protein